MVRQAIRSSASPPSARDQRHSGMPIERPCDLLTLLHPHRTGSSDGSIDPATLFTGVKMSQLRPPAPRVRDCRTRGPIGSSITILRAALVIHALLHARHCPHHTDSGAPGRSRSRQSTSTVVGSLSDMQIEHHEQALDRIVQV